MSQDVRIYSYETSTSVYLFGDTATTFNLEYGGWTTETPVFTGTETALETFIICASGTYANVLSAYNGLIDLLNRVRVSQQKFTRQRTFSVFLVVNTDVDDRSGVSDTRKAAIVDYEIEPLTEYYLGPHIPPETASGTTTFKFRLTIERMGVWETFQTTGAKEDEEDVTANTTGLSSLGGVWTTTIGNRGSAIGRIPHMAFSYTGGIERGWLGIREPSDPSNPSETPNVQWNLHNGTLESGNTSDTDSSAEDGTRVTIAMGSTLVKEVAINSTQASAQGIAHTGRFLVLGRFKLAATGECIIQMRSGNEGTTNYKRHDFIFFSDTSWRLKELGVVEIPSASPALISQNASFYTLYRSDLQIWTQTLTGSSTLHADLLILIPAEHYVYFDNGYSATRTEVYTNTYWNYYVKDGDVTKVTDSTVIKPNNWNLNPRTDNIVIVTAGERSASSVDTDTFNINAFNIIYGWQHFLDSTT